MELHEIGQDSDFFCAFVTVGESPELGQEPASLQLIDVLLLGGYLQGIKNSAELG